MQIILTRSHSASSLLIRGRLSLERREIERYSHGMIIHSGSEIIDSTFEAGGVRPRPLATALHGVSNYRRLDIPLPDEAAGMGFAEAQIGKDYDWRACYGWARGNRAWQDDYAWFCFELIAAAIRAGGLDVFADLSRVTGNDLERLALQLQHEQLGRHVDQAHALALA